MSTLLTQRWLLSRRHFLRGLGATVALPLVARNSFAASEAEGKLILKSKVILKETSPLMHASYLTKTGLEMVKIEGYSPDNGQTWTRLPPTPDFEKDLPYGYRRDSFPLFVDHSNGKILRIVASMDTPGLDPNIVEPPVSMETYYLRYRVSVDGGKTYLFDEQIIQKGHTAQNPFDNVHVGKNGVQPGDVASQVIRTPQGRILVPAQASKLGPDGTPARLSGGVTSDTDIIIVIGKWRKDNRLDWEISQPIEADPARSTRGMIEPTLAEMPDGRLLCVMRGSNGGKKDPDYQLPSYKWYSVSKDGGYHWAKPAPWTYDDGSPFYSPSSMSCLLRHSSGRYFWIGNISPTNCRGNNPRHPLVIGEVNRKSFLLIKDSLLEVDTKQANETDVNLSHFWAIEDRANGDIVIPGTRYDLGYKSSQAVFYRIGFAVSR